MQASGEAQSGPNHRIAAEAYRLGRPALCIFTAIVAVVMAVVGWWLVGIGPVFTSKVFALVFAFILLPVSALFWVPCALVFRVRHPSLGLALSIGAASPLLVFAPFPLLLLYFHFSPVRFLILFLRAAPVGLVTGYLVHTIALAKPVRSSRAPGGA